MINLIITNNSKKINKEKKSQRIKKKLIINNMKANFKFNLFKPSSANKSEIELDFNKQQQKNQKI